MNTRSTLWVLLACVALEVAYVCSFSPFPTIDSASHIGSSWSLLRYLQGTDPLTLELFELNPVLVPNLGSGVVLSLLMLLMSPAAAEQALILGYVIGLPLALYYAILQVRREAAPLALFALPVTFSFPFLFGFFNFCWSLVVLLLVTAVALKSRPPLSWGRVATLAGLVFCAYLAHFVGFVASCAVVASWAVAHAYYERKLALATLSRAALALSPSVLLAARFMLSSGTSSATQFSNPLKKGLRTLVFEWGLSAYERSERVICVALALAFWGLLVVSLRQKSLAALRTPRALTLLLSCAGLFLLATLGPEATASGAVHISPRLAVILILIGVLLLAEIGVPQKLTPLAMGVPALVALALGIVRSPTLRAVESRLGELSELERAIEPQRVMVQANLTDPHYGTLARLHQLTAESGRLTAARDGIDLGNCDLVLPLWTLRFKAPLNPYAAKLILPGHGYEEAPPPLDLVSYERSVGIDIDYVLLAGRPVADSETLASPIWQDFDRQLTSGYAKKARTSSGYWELWAKRSKN